MNYKLTNTNNILCLDTGLWIPGDPKNSDWVAYQQWLSEGNTPLPADPAPIVPNSQGFISCLKTAMGGIVGANLLMRAYPAFYDAVNTGQWGDVQALILDAQKTGTITPIQYTEFQTLAAQNNIPITL